MIDALLAGAGAILVAAIWVHSPTMRHIQLRVIQLRAAWMTIPQAWAAAKATARYEWPENVRRAQHDV